MIQRTLRRWLFVLPCTWAVLLTGSASDLAAPALLSAARADDQAVPLKAQARSLFEEAKKLVAQTRYADACPKFQESQRLDPGLGTKFYLADCLEHIGRYASAWVLYMEVADEAGEAKMGEREEYAKKRADNLAPKLTRMVIVLADDVKTIPGIEVRRDGVVVASGQWGLPLPVDAGKHTVAVGAPSKRSWETSVEASGEGAVITVTIPTLKDDAGAAGPAATSTAVPSAGPAGPAAGAEGTTWSIQRSIALGVGGVGLVGLGLGIGLGVDAAGKVSGAKSECNDATPAICTQKGSDLLDGAKTSGTVSTVGFIAGGALLVGGVVLFLTAPSGAKEGDGGKGDGGEGGKGAKGKVKEARRSTWIAPVVGSTNGVTLGGTW